MRVALLVSTLALSLLDASEPRGQFDFEAVSWAHQLKKKDSQRIDVQVVDDASNRIDAEDCNWIKKMLQQDPHVEAAKAHCTQSSLTSFEKKKCTTSISSTPDEVAPIYILISFSVPDHVWVGLSKELENKGGIFVLRGLPRNSFKELSKKIQHLDKLGVKVPIQINPKLFTAYQATLVPTFLIQYNEGYDKITGNISLTFALEKAALERSMPCAL